MSENNGDNGSIDYSQLHVYAGPAKPDMSKMTVYAEDTLQFLDTVIQANIIGSSHYINAPELGYREMTSCRPIDMLANFNPVSMNYDITDMSDVRLHRQANGYDVEILIQALGLWRFPTRADWDLAYTFGDEETGAPTTITFNNAGWVTWHTYPEFNIALFTETTFTPA